MEVRAGPWVSSSIVRCLSSKAESLHEPYLGLHCLNLAGGHKPQKYSSLLFPFRAGVKGMCGVSTLLHEFWVSSSSPHSCEASSLNHQAIFLALIR